ncbi:MAG TPA: amidohydrolase family protein [Pyrinomonadaceae bacterium]|nr:amidohydrolase family protein [Pyrinomonadaceae bacterium]
MTINRRLKIALFALAACALLPPPATLPPAATAQGAHAATAQDARTATAQDAHRVAAHDAHGAAARSVEERGKFKLYKYQVPVGEETYEINRAGDSLQLAARSELTFIGDKVQLTATLDARRDLTPVRFEIKGQTSTRSDIDASVEVEDGVARVREGARTRSVRIEENFYPTGGLAPVSMQMWLFRYWQRQQRGGQRGRALALLPGGSARIERRGRDAVTAHGKQVQLERYHVEGVTWGRETVWFDAAGQLVAVVGADAELDRFEAVREGYEAALPVFVKRGAEDAVAQLEQLQREIRPQRAGLYALVGGLLIDGRRDAPVPDSIVVVDGDRILAAGPRATVRIPRGAARVDARGLSVLAGLWDTHGHNTQVEWFPASLAAGVTTVRDAGNEPEFIVPIRDAIRSGRALAPRLLLAGVIDGGASPLGTITAETPAEARAAVARYHSLGYEQIKIYQSLKPELVGVVAAEAHRLGLTVTGHVPIGTNAFNAVEAGMDQINHINFITRLMHPRDFKFAPGSPPPPLDLESPAAQAGIDYLRRHGTVVEPTLARAELNLHPRASDFADFEPGIAKLPYELFVVLNNTGVPAEAGERAKAAFERSLKLTGRLHRGGVPLMAGSDLVVPGHSMFRELELLVRAGLSPLEAVRAATLVPARAFRMDGELGTVEAGKRADLILVAGNPLDSISHIRRVKYVVTRGRMYDCAALWQSVGFRP